MNIRDHMAPNVGTLGKKIEREKLDFRGPDEQVAPGVFKNKDGKLYTSIPEAELANVPTPIYDWAFIK
jgi:hypothetical protein